MVLSVGALGAPASTAQPGSTQPWMDRHLSPEQRARLLLAQMTLAEKVDLMTGNQGEASRASPLGPDRPRASRSRRAMIR
jgi:hypothetical protein